jgi:hypothetical protein
MIFQWKWLFDNIFKGYAGITIFVFIIVDDRNNKVLINHEQIHIRQSLELGFIGFWFLYLLEYVFKFYHFGNADVAYQNISFEQEAYKNESDLQYLKKRKFYSWTEYM